MYRVLIVLLLSGCTILDPCIVQHRINIKTCVDTYGDHRSLDMTTIEDRKKWVNSYSCYMAEKANYWDCRYHLKHDK